MSLNVVPILASKSFIVSGLTFSTFIHFEFIFVYGICVWHPKEISPGCSLEGLMLKLKLQYFGHLMGTVDSLEKTLMLGRTGGSRRRG